MGDKTYGTVSYRPRTIVLPRATLPCQTVLLEVESAVVTTIMQLSCIEKYEAAFTAVRMEQRLQGLC